MSANSTTTLRARRDAGSGHEYEVRLYVRDANGDAATDSVTTSERD